MIRIAADTNVLSSTVPRCDGTEAAAVNARQSLDRIAALT